MIKAIHNVDVRQDQRYLAEKDLFPCGDKDESRFSPDFEVPLSILGMKVAGDSISRGTAIVLSGVGMKCPTAARKMIGAKLFMCIGVRAAAWLYG